MNKKYYIIYKNDGTLRCKIFLNRQDYENFELYEDNILDDNGNINHNFEHDLDEDTFQNFLKTLQKHLKANSINLDLKEFMDAEEE